MKIDIMRKILLKIDAIESGIIDQQVNLNEFSNEELQYYCLELAREGFIEITGSPFSSDVLSGSRLTLDGRNFIRVAKNQVLWKNAVKSIESAKRTFPSENLTSDVHEMKFHFISMSN